MKNVLLYLKQCKRVFDLCLTMVFLGMIIASPMIVKATDFTQATTIFVNQRVSANTTKGYRYEKHYYKYVHSLEHVKLSFKLLKLKLYRTVKLLKGVRK